MKQDIGIDYSTLKQESHQCGCVFKIKIKLDGLVCKHKARLVARGFLQKSGLNYFEVFALVARHETVRLVLT